MSRTLLSLSITAILAGGTALADGPRVAVDIAPVHSLVARVMDGVGTPDLVIRSGASPHEYSLRPSEASALQKADLVFWIGADLTPWLGKTIATLATDATVTALLGADGTLELEFREDALFEAHDHGDHDDHAEHDDDHADHEDHGDEDHADHDEHGDEDHADHDEHGDEDHADHDEHGDEDHADHGDEKDHDDHGEDDHDDHAGHEGHDHGALDPHAWLSVRNASTWLNVIAGKLSAADPDNAGVYFANAAAGRAEMDALATEVNGVLDPVRGGRFVVFHDAYQYFEADFEFEAFGAIALSDASDPSPARIATIKDRIAEQGIDCVLAEPQFNAGLVDTVLDGTQAKSAVLDPLGSDLEPGPEFYPQLIRNLSLSLARCL